MKVPNASTKCGDTEDAIETDPADGSQISQPEHSATNETSARAPYSEAQDLCSPLTVHSLGPEVDLPPISGSVPSNWKSIEGEFICVTPFMIPLTSKSFYGDPTLPIGSGKIRIGVCDGHLTRLGMLELIIKTTTGQHLEMEGVWCIDVKAFRLEPHATPTMLTIDGEEVNCGVLQCQIHPGLARLMCRRRQLEHSQA